MTGPVEPRIVFVGCVEEGRRSLETLLDMRANVVAVFTLRGELVLDSNAQADGMFYWQGTNRGGRLVASGVYLVVVEGNGIKAIRKLAIIR